MTESAPLGDVLMHAARAWQRFARGEALERAIAQAIGERMSLRPAVLDVTMSAVRHRALLEAAIARLASRPPPPATAALLAVALAQLLKQRHEPHTIVDQAVEAARASGQAASAGFVNAILRNFLRKRQTLLEELASDDVVRLNAPRWWLERLRRAQPQAWEQIATTALEQPPLVLRVNRRRTTVAQALERLAAAGHPATQVGESAVWLHRPRPVELIPGFAAGELSVQDAGAQLAAQWLGAEDKMRVLDACAAPGGKTAHLAELADLDLTALELDPARAQRIDDNLARSGGTADVVVADAANPDAWWDGRTFDRVLLDAPCTASGIVRRHPDVPWLRRPSDVAHLATLQARLLDALWPLLKVGGRLLYVVCSVFPEEGREQITRFLARTPEARAVPLPAGSPVVELVPTPVTARTWSAGEPLPTLHDGFFYAMCEKIR